MSELPEADRHERYRGWEIDARYVPGKGWIVQWGDRHSGRQHSYEVGLPYADMAAGVARRFIDNQFSGEAAVMLGRMLGRVPGRD